MENMKDLPIGWEWTTVEEITDLIRGVSYKKDEARELPSLGLLPILRATNIQDESLILDSQLVYVPISRIKDEQKLIPGDVVICISSGSKHLVGKAAQLHREWDGSFGTFCMAARLKPNVNLRYAGYFFGSPNYRSEIRKKSSGININNLRSEHIGSVAFPLPPLPEQQRIVERIESLFTQLDAGVAGLKRAKAALKRYKASVLKAAVEGRLAPQDPHDEPAEEVLKRILAERGEKFTPHEGELGELPKGWCWARVGDLSKVGTGATPLRNQPKYWDNATVPWVTSSALNELFVKSADKFITETALIETNVKVFPAGSLLVAMYGEGRTRGKVSELLIDATTNQACSALIFEGLFAECKPYVKLFFQKNYEDIRRLSSGNVQPNLNLSIIKNTRIPLPPLTEQNRIVAEVERWLSVVQELEQAIEANLKRAGRLRQAILKRAFEGRLVRQ